MLYPLSYEGIAGAFYRALFKMANVNETGEIGFFGVCAAHEVRRTLVKNQRALPKLMIASVS